MIARLEDTSTEERIRMHRDKLVELLGLTSRNFVLMAEEVKALEALGDDLSDLPIPFLKFLRRIGDKQLAPEVLERFFGERHLLETTSRLSLSEQKFLAAGEPVKIVDIFEGKPVVRCCDPKKLGRKELAQVFADDHIRNEAEQISWLKENRPPDRKLRNLIDVDLRRKGIYVRAPGFIPLDELRGLVKRIGGR